MRPTIDEQIKMLNDMDGYPLNSSQKDMLIFCLERLKQIDAQEPVEPEGGYWTWTRDGMVQLYETGEYVSKHDYDTLQAALKQANERAEAAEEANRRMVELLREPSEEMIDAAEELIPWARGTESRSGFPSPQQLFKAMSAELLKEFT